MGATPKTGEAINGAIFLMLGFIFAILGGVGAFIYNLAKRARSPLPPLRAWPCDMGVCRLFQYGCFSC